MGSIARASLGIAAAVLLTAAGCGDTDDGDESGSPAGDGGGATTVSVDDNLFDPESAEISVGDTVTWEWVGNEPHNVNADDFKSDIQQEGTFEHTFDEAGSFDYVCTIHPGMAGTVEVS